MPLIKKPGVSRFHIFLSEQAVFGLKTHIAQQLDCPPQLSRIIRRIPIDPLLWQDTRPSELTVNDELFQEQGMPIMWSFEVPRYRQQVLLPIGTVNGLVTLAEAFCIQNHMRPVAGLRPHSRLSSVVEAIGLGFLTLEVYTKDG